MVILENKNAKIKYNYYFTWVNALNNNELRDAIVNHTTSRQTLNNGGIKRYRVGGKKYGKTYIDIPMSFDIETSKYYADKVPYSTMYCWQTAINDVVIMGRYWFEFIKLLERIKEIIKPKKKQRVLCAVHNLSFEFSFMRDWLNVTDSFLKEQRTPLTIEHDEFFIFIDTLALTQQKLSKLAETYTNTQKCVGDLDYNLIRHSKTPLTNDEIGYCHNDVLILSEYMRYYNDTYLAIGKRPLTATGVLNDEVQTRFSEYCEEHENERTKVQLAQPSKEEYETLMNFCYRGGYVHGDRYYIDEILEGMPIMGVDFTSSYPASMMFKKYGIKWRKCYDVKTVEDVHERYNQGRATIFMMELHNVKNKGAHSIESKSKCIELEGETIDNGRILSAKKMVVYLTMLDLFNYERFYTWSDDYIIYNVKISKMEYCPSYLLQPMLHYYALKNELKSKGLDETIEYKLSKSKVNSFYGLTVKRVPLQRVVYTNDGWKVEESTSYEKQVEKKALVPYIGLFVSAWSRYSLLQTVADLEGNGVNCYYMDTDSIKCDDNEKSRAIIKAYNDEIKRQTDEAIKRTGASEFVRGLGEFDVEFGEGSKHGKIERLKILGAKRYILETEKGYKLQTIAGLPKQWLFDKVKDKDHEFYGKDPFELFTNHLTATDCKLTTKYIDTPFKHVITDYNGEELEVQELSCVSLVETDFNMKLDDTWYAMILEEKIKDSVFL